MNRFDRIRVQGFRRLSDAKLKLGPLNVFIGANGSGKTSLLDVFSLLAASAQGKLQTALNDLGGIDGNLSRLAVPDAAQSRGMAFELTMEVPQFKPLEYRLEIAPHNASYRISDESLSQDQGKAAPFKHLQARHGDVRYFTSQPGKKGGLVKPTWEYDAHESALSQVPKMFREPEEFRNRLASSISYHVIDVGRNAPVRRPQQMRDAKLPGTNGEDLVSCLYSVRETDPDRFETIEANLRLGFPGFERLNFPPVAAGVLAMTWKEKSSKTPFFMHQLSEGTLRFLWLVTLLNCPGLTALTILDEPEVSLHPELSAIAAELLRDASHRTQLLVATHSDRLIRHLKPEEVVAFDLNEDGSAELTRADALDLDRWLSEYTLDQVWQMGQIGGRP